MIEIGEKYLPIGTVVLLKNAEKKIMITGFASMSPQTGDAIFDYSGCIYPEGFLNYEEVCVFNHEQIERVFYKGFVDNEEIEFKKELVDQLSRISVPNDSPSENDVENN